MWTRLIPLGTVAAIIAGTLWTYWPGLTGPFLFDDLANLPALADFGGVRDTTTLRLYLLNGFAGPTGRPLSLLSFLLDDTAWPSSPYGFKHTNLLLHVLTGLLLLWIVYRLCLIRGMRNSTAFGIGAVSAGYWLIHPFNVSTTLYVIQRMAILSTMFIFLGILVYLLGREKLSSHRTAGYAWITGGVILASLMATFSKENGAILPTLILIIEILLLRPLRRPAPSQRWLWVFLGMPTVLILSYLGWTGLHPNYYWNRPFTASERLLTETRVLCDYLFHWIIPWVPPRGLFTENYPISFGLFSPPSTLPAVIALATGALLTLKLRKRLPSLALGYWFFLGGHVIESTTIPLELYFEHRNYLSAAFLFMPVAEFVMTNSEHRKLLMAFVCILAIGLGATTHRLTTIWGNENRLANFWAANNPDSSRAQSVAADILDRNGRGDLALKVLANAVAKSPGDISLDLHYLVEKCFVTEVTPTEYSNHLGLLRRVPFDFKSFPFLDNLIQTLPHPNCHGIGYGELNDLLAALAENPKALVDTGAQRQLHHLRGVLYVRQRHGGKALEEFKAGLKLRPDPSSALLEVALLGSHGMPRDALDLLALIPNLPKNKSTIYGPMSDLDYHDEITRLRSTLEQDLNRAPTKSIGVEHTISNPAP